MPATFVELQQRVCAEFAMLRKQKKSKLILLAVLALSLPLLVVASMIEQDIRQRASAPATAPVTATPTGGIEFGFNKALILKGGYLRLNQSQNLYPQLGFTVEAWIKPYTADIDYSRIISKEYNRQTNFALMITSEPEPGTNNYRLQHVFAVSRNTPGWNCASLSSAKIQYVPASAVTEWQHIAGVVQPNGRIDIYVNGEKASTAETIPGVCQLNYPVYVGVGTRNNEFREYFNGAIDELRISKVPRYTDSFVVKKEPLITDSDTIAHYRFDGDANDGSGNNYHGVVTGEAVFDESLIAPEEPTPIITITPTFTPTPIIVPTDTPTPTPTRTPTPTLTPTPTPTPTVTPTPAPRLRLSAKSINVRIRQGETKHVVNLFSTGATTFLFQNKPVNANQNIRWVPQSGSLKNGQIVSIKITVGPNVPARTYTGTARLRDTSTPGAPIIQVPVTVTVEQNRNNRR